MEDRVSAWVFQFCVAWSGALAPFASGEGARLLAEPLQGRPPVAGRKEGLFCCTAVEGPKGRSSVTRGSGFLT